MKIEEVERAIRTSFKMTDTFKRKMNYWISKERAGPVDREHTANVMKTLHSLRAQGIATDLTVQCKDGEFKAHSVVLLTSGLADRVKEARENVLDLSVTASGVAVLLDYVYLGRARLSLENGLSALEVSRRLQMRDLFDKCRKFICPFMLDPSKMAGMTGLPPSDLSEKRIEVKIDQKIDKINILNQPANDKFKKDINSKVMMENPKNLNAHLPANMQSAVKRILPAKPIVKPIASGEPPVAPESIKSKDLEDKSDIESVASSYTTGSEQTVTPSSSDNEESSVTESNYTEGNDSDNSAGTTSSLGSLVNNRKPRRQKSVKWV